MSSDADSPNGQHSYLHPATLLANEVLSSYRRLDHLAEVFDPVITDKAAQALIRLAYDSSLLEEEGHFPKVRLIVHAERPTMTFGGGADDQAVELTSAETLKKVAATACRVGFALAITEVDDHKLFCRGVYDVNEPLVPLRLTPLDEVWEPSEILDGSLLSVRIEGPGRIRAAYLPGHAFLLQGGRVNRREPWIALRPAAKLISRIAKEIVENVRGSRHPHADHVAAVPHITTQFVQKAWAHVLTAAVSMRRGGTFVVLMGEDADTEDGVTANLSLSKNIIRYMNLSLAWSNQDFSHFLTSWRVYRSGVFTLAEQIACLSAVDGCVLLNQDLDLLRFGVKLKAHATTPLEIPSELKASGTRHKSAIHYCAVHKAIAFVVSQDGKLTVVASGASGPEILYDADPGVNWADG